MPVLFSTRRDQRKIHQRESQEERRLNKHEPADKVDVVKAELSGMTALLGDDVAWSSLTEPTDCDLFE